MTHEYLSRKTSMHTDWISSLLRECKVCCVVGTFTSDEELSRAAQSDNGIRSGAWACCVRGSKSRLWCDFFPVCIWRPTLSLWLLETLRRKSGSSSSRHSDCSRSRKPHLTRHGVFVSEGSDENFLNECELWKVAAVLTSVLVEWYGSDVSGSSDSDGELYIMLLSEDMWCISENTNLEFNLYKFCNIKVVSAKQIYVL